MSGIPGREVTEWPRDRLTCHEREARSDDQRHQRRDQHRAARLLHDVVYLRHARRDPHRSVRRREREVHLHRRDRVRPAHVAAGAACQRGLHLGPRAFVDRRNGRARSVAGGENVAGAVEEDDVMGAAALEAAEDVCRLARCGDGGVNQPCLERQAPLEFVLKITLQRPPRGPDQDGDGKEEDDNGSSNEPSGELHLVLLTLSVPLKR
jgi:hypothetical protein